MWHRPCVAGASPATANNKSTHVRILTPASAPHSIPVILSEVAVREADGTQSKDPCNACATKGTSRRSHNAAESTGTPCDSAGASGVRGIFRLRNCFASRGSYSAQDDSAKVEFVVPSAQTARFSVNLRMKHPSVVAPGKNKLQGGTYE